MAKNCSAFGSPAGHMIQAVSDGELNLSARGCGASSSCLPATPGGDAGAANGVMSWAVSFEKLLEDPFGVQNFTSFLRSEVSAENILFWQACEKFRMIPHTSVEELKAGGRSIYDTYLSDSSPYSVNIDDTAKMEKKDLERPTPDMFNKAQEQIFKLMKMDSYRRFVRSPLYQKCTYASVDPRSLRHLGSWEDVAKNSTSSCDKIKVHSSASERQHQKRGSLGAIDVSTGFVTPNELPVYGKSTSNVELSSFYRQLENGRLSPLSPQQGGGEGGSRIGVEGGYCCVYLPDGSASLAPTPNGQAIKDMLASLCEKRGFPLKDVVIYLHGKDKVQLPLSLDQDCSVLRDQQVSLELRVTFALEIAFTGKTMGIMVKSSKKLQDALSAVLQKHNLKLQDVLVTIVGSNKPVNMNETVFRLANKTLRLDKAKGRDVSKAAGAAAASQAGPVSTRDLEARSSPHIERSKAQLRPSKNREMDGFLEMLTRAQCYRVDDQRGLLTKEQLKVPQFLQLPSDEGLNTQSDQNKSSATSSSTADCTESRDNKSSLPASSSRDTEEPTHLWETTI